MQYLTQDEIVILKNLCTVRLYMKNLKIPFPFLNVAREGGLMDMALRVCVYYEITFDAFISPRRNKILVDARTDFCHFARKTTKYGCNQIGKFMNRDHTSVLHHWKKKPVCLDDIILKANGGEKNESENK